SHNSSVAPPVTHWQPEVGPKRIEPRRHDSDQGCGLAVENEGFVENVWIATEFRLPEVVVHHEHWRSIRAAIIWREGAPEERRNAQEIECVGRDSFTSRPVADGFAVVVLEAYAVILKSGVLEALKVQ